MLRVLVAALLAVTCCLGSARAALPQSMGVDAAIRDAVCEQLRSRDDATRAAGIRRIDELMLFDGRAAAHTMAHSWGRMLLLLEKFQVLNRLSEKAILAAPDETAIVEVLQDFRARSLLHIKGGDRATAAVGLFNIASIKTTESQYELIVRCLRSALGAKGDAGLRFLAEQWNPTPKTRGVFARLRVNRNLYRGPISELNGGDFTTLMGKGNLLLLADRVDEAMACFKGALSAAAGSEKAIAREAIARAIKSEDGNPIRARQWLAGEESAGAAGAGKSTGDRKS